MFRFRKFQKGVDTGKSKFLFFWNINVTTGTVLFNIFCILFPCLFICVNLGFAYEEFEFHHGDFVTINSVFDDVASISTCSISERVIREKPLLFNESRLEGNSGFIELLPLHKVNSIFVSFLNQFHTSFISEVCAQSSTAKSGNDSRNSTDNNDTGSGHDKVSFQFVIGYIILLIFCMCIGWAGGLWFFYYFIQRKAQPEQPSGLRSDVATG